MVGMAKLASPLLAAVIAAALPAQDQNQVVSGPKAGTDVPSVNVYYGQGRDAGKELDLANRLGKGPAVLLFVHELSRNTAPVIRGVDQIGTDYGILGLETYAIMLMADRTQGENRLRAVNGSLRMRSPLCLSLDGAEGPGGMALNRKCTVTLVFTKDGKVVRSAGFTDTGQNDVPKVKRWVEELTGPLPTDPKELAELIEKKLPTSPEELRKHAVALTMQIQRMRKQIQNLQNRNRNNRRRGGNQARMREGQMRRGQQGRGQQGRGQQGRGQQNQRPANAKKRDNEPRRANTRRVGKPPEDERLMSLLRSYIRKTNTNEQVEETFADIEARVGDDAGLRSQAVEMFKLMLSLTYGSEYARKQAKAYVDKHGKQK